MAYQEYDHQQGYPQPQQQQVVVIQNQPTTSNCGQPQNIREWSTDLCGCFEDCSSCCYAYWFHPCFLCTLATSMDECYCGPHCCGTGCANIFTTSCFAPVSPNIFLVAMRTKLRAQYGIRGSVLKDVCYIWCCEFCASTQMYREIKHVG